MPLKNIKLRAYQQKAVKKLESNNKLLLIARPGLGKTLIILTRLKNLFDSGAVNNVLIISTVRICKLVWPQEVIKWGFDFSVSVVHGTAQQRLKALHTAAQIYLINFDNLQWLDQQNILFDAIVIDEITFLKNSTSKRFKALKKDLLHYQYVYGLTGTPLTNNYEDLFGQVYIVGGAEPLGRNITQYRNTYFDTGYMSWDRTLKPGADIQIQQQIKDLVHIIPVEGNIDLPKCTVVDIAIELPTEARKQYNVLKRELRIQLQQLDIVAQNAGVAAIKLRQLCNGAVYHTTTGAWEEVHNEKIIAVHEICESLQGSPVIIVYEFRHDLERLKKALPHAKEFKASMTSKQMGELLRNWENGEIPQLLIHPASAGHGLNLQNGPGHNMIWFGVPYDLNHYEQTIARLDRQGQQRPVFVHRLVAQNTIESNVVAPILRDKAITQNEFIDRLLVYCSAD